MKAKARIKKGSVKSEVNEDTYLTEIPVLGYFFKRIKESRQAIETTLETGKRTEDEPRQKHFLGGLIGMISQKTFHTLNFKKNKSWQEK